MKIGETVGSSVSWWFGSCSFLLLGGPREQVIPPPILAVVFISCANECFVTQERRNAGWKQHSVVFWSRKPHAPTKTG